MWLALAISASALWGIAYALHEQVYKHVSVLTSLTVSYALATIGLLVALVATKAYQNDLATIMGSKQVTLLIGAEALISTLAALLIGLSIQGRDATVAGLIEMSYPLFIIIFTYFLFRENHLTWSVAVGGALIFSGIAVIYLFNR